MGTQVFTTKIIMGHSWRGKEGRGLLLQSVDATSGKLTAGGKDVC